MRHSRKIENDQEGVLLSYRRFHTNLKPALLTSCLPVQTATAPEEVSDLFIVRVIVEYV